MRIEDLDRLASEWIGAQRLEEKAESTIKQYTHSIGCFVEFAERSGDDEVTKRLTMDYKDALVSEMRNNVTGGKGPRRGRGSPGARTVSTVNLRLIALNKFLRDNGLGEYTVRTMRSETSNTTNSELSESEYARILEWADRLGLGRTRMILESLAGTGMRVSELGFLTVESLKTRMPLVTGKGKTRTVFVPRGLTERLRRYCADNGISSGVIFHGMNPDRLMNMTRTRLEFKKIAGKARGIRLDKAHFHSLRHLFARRYANMPGSNPYYLPLLLGHTSGLTVTELYVKPEARELLGEVDRMEAFYGKQAEDEAGSCTARKSRKRRSRDVRSNHFS